ncbi:hypothetical protein [Rhizobium sp. G21]|uniref:hypothetical protein n=1 Tax=Rhizobium sp. G21 TaxID=2758439 RepID=UPI0039180762
MQGHERIGYVHQGHTIGWNFTVEGKEITLEGGCAFRTNDAEHVRGAVLAGLGIAHHASWLFPDVLASGEVARVLDDYAPPLLPINAIIAGGAACRLGCGVSSISSPTSAPRSPSCASDSHLTAPTTTDGADRPLHAKLPLAASSTR